MSLRAAPDPQPPPLSFQSSFEGYLKRAFSVTAAFQVTEDFKTLTSKSLHSAGVTLDEGLRRTIEWYRAL